MFVSEDLKVDSGNAEVIYMDTKDNITVNDVLKLTGLTGPPYDYKYRPPAALDDSLDTPKYLASARALHRTGIEPALAQRGDVPGAVYEPKDNSDFEYRVSTRIFTLIKNTPEWYASEDEIKSIGISVEHARNGLVFGVAYDAVGKEGRTFKVSTVHYRNLERILEEGTFSMGELENFA